MKTFRLLAVISLLLLITCAAYADYSGQISAPGQTWTWSDTDWYAGPSGTCQLDVTLDWRLPLVGPSAGFGIGGIKAEDPVVNQLVTNYSTLLWSDWHVQLRNGRLRDGSVVVKKNGTTETWDVTYGAIPGYDSGFTAIAWPPAELVGNNDKLSVYFAFDPIDPRQRVVIQQWPTTDFAPEPGCIITLGMGLAGLGFGLKRRRM